jgi:hypothetical protein
MRQILVERREATREPVEPARELHQQRCGPSHTDP